MEEFVDTSEYSDDGNYRWWYERRWGAGEGLCWVGLNPSTGDTTGRPRPTLRKVVERARLWVGTTKHGEPRHPLYVRSDTQVLPYVREPN